MLEPPVAVSRGLIMGHCHRGPDGAQIAIAGVAATMLGEPPVVLAAASGSVIRLRSLAGKVCCSPLHERHEDLAR